MAKRFSNRVRLNTAQLPITKMSDFSLVQEAFRVSRLLATSIYGVVLVENKWLSAF